MLFLKEATRFNTDGAHLHGRWIIETLRRYEGDPPWNILAPIERQWRGTREVARSQADDPTSDSRAAEVDSQRL